MFGFYSASFLLTSFLLSLANAVYQQQQHPHVILIVADDLGWNDVSFHDPVHQIPTPNIDALAMNGVILNRHYSQHLCTPSRAALMTGEYPIHNGMQHWVIDIDEPWALPADRKLMPQYFKDADYDTYMVGKWHLGFHEKIYTPLERGYDRHFGYWGPYIDYWNKTMIKLSRPYNRGLDFRDGEEVIWENNTYATELFTKAAVSYINQHPKDKPMFMVVNHLAPHTANEDDPMQAPKEEIKKFNYIRDPKRRIYAAMVSLLDKSVGKIITSLNENQMLNNCIVVFMSDNGAPSVGLHSNAGSNYPFRGQKNSPWEGAVRVPAFIWSSLIQKSRRTTNQLFHVTDWLPTLLTGAGINVNLKLHNNIDGVDQWHSIAYESQSPRTELLININPIEGFSALIKDGWKILNKTADKFDTWITKGNIDSIQKNFKVYAGSVMSSDVSRALGKLDLRLIERLSKQSQVRCVSPPVPEYNPFHCNPAKSPCLFNIELDPCEYYNIASLFPGVFHLMQASLKRYELGMVPSLYKPTDPNCNPLYFNDTWVSWNDYPPNDKNMMNLLYDIINT